MSPRVLVIEDNTDVRALVMYQLEAAGLTVLSATNGREGLETALRESPDLVLTDLMLPTLNGYEVCSFLKQHTQHHGIPVIIWSATKIQPKDEQLAKECGADRFLLKTIESDTLIQEIRLLLQTSGGNHDA